ncbi:Ku protein [Pseudoroseomonas globiformis]|uniref:Non-homologous end joining protein Ku n=1 Tax=Teichococcus globiformis TaxID=2307229 RepID=A0ABV7G7A8_9PROT
MNDRPVWRGTLRLALVSCRIALLPARQERNALHFNMINPKTGNRIRNKAVDAVTGREVERSELVRGFEVEKDEYILFSDEDFDKARIESSRTLTIAKFVKQGEIGPLYYENAYYLVPQEDEGADVYVVLREALRKSGMVALSRLVLFRRERPVAILPMDRGLVLHTLHEEGDLRDAAEAFAEVPRSSPEAEMVKLAQQLIQRQTSEYDPADTEDRYASRLRALIEERRQGHEPSDEPEEEEPSGNVVDLMAALRESLKQGGRGTSKAVRKAPAKSSAPKKSDGSKPSSRKSGATKPGTAKDKDRARKRA